MITMDAAVASLLFLSAALYVSGLVVSLSSKQSIDDREGGLRRRNAHQVWANFSKVTCLSRTTTTLQVVANPILERTFTLKDGSTIPNPIHGNAFQSLQNLQADLVRYVPWFPYPKVSVAELDKPSQDGKTSWDFTNILPMLTDFMDATYARNHTTVINFSTQPCWLFGDDEQKPIDCSYPDNPDESFFRYVRGDRKNLLDPTSNEMADYYARLLQYLVNGEFVDEAGNKISGGPKYDLSGGHIWELFNEGEHNYVVEQYIQDYDVVVAKMIEAVGKDRAPKFMGIGGANPAWIGPFLNDSLHKNTTYPPIDYISEHFYATCTNRTDPSTYASDFFGHAKDFVERVKEMMRTIASSDYPYAKLVLNELGVIMPADNDPNRSIDADLPDIYWNAAGAMFAYLFTEFVPLGVDVMGHSQLAGSPEIPEWNIPLPQFPSVSLLDWRTGLGNARYWVLKLLLEEFQPGDMVVDSGVASSNKESIDNNIALVAVIHTSSCCGTHKKVLLVNKQMQDHRVCLNKVLVGEVHLRIVDPVSVQRGSDKGIREEVCSNDDYCVLLRPFAVVVATAPVPKMLARLASIF